MHQISKINVGYLMHLVCCFIRNFLTRLTDGKIMNLWEENFHNLHTGPFTLMFRFISFQVT